jgi:hypothetical protein
MARNYVGVRKLNEAGERGSRGSLSQPETAKRGTARLIYP